MSRARFRRIHVAVIVALLATVISACAGSGASSSSGSPASGGLEKTTITVAALPVVDTVGLFIAKKEGFFQQAGLTVNVKMVAQSTAAISAMLAGSVDMIAGGNYVSFIEGDAHGAFKIRVLVDGTACGHHTFSVLALPKSGIKSPGDLVGKTVAVNITNNIQTLMLNALLKADNIDATKVRYVAIPFPNMAAALQTGKVDAISVMEPFLTGAEQSLGATEIADQCVGAQSGMPLSGYFVTDTWAQKYPNTARAFQTALDKGQALADSNRAVIEQVLPTYTKITAKVAALIAINTFPTSLDAMRLQRVANLMQSGGLLTSQFNVAPLLFK